MALIRQKFGRMPIVGLGEKEPAGNSDAIVVVHCEFLHRYDL